MLRLTGVVGRASDPELGERLHALAHADAVEYLVLEHADMARHRLRMRTDRGTECAIALPRDQALSNGAVLLLDEARAIVVRMREEAWLVLRPRDLGAALELGYLAGNMHWRARFKGPAIEVALDGEEAGYLARLRPLLDGGRVERAEDV